MIIEKTEFKTTQANRRSIEDIDCIAVMFPVDFPASTAAEEMSFGKVLE